METNALKDLLYGGLLELMKNRKYFHDSSLPKYSYWTEEGLESVKEYITLLTPQICEAELAKLDKHAKKMVLKHLKGDL
jgi:hypothetical protein